MPDYRSSFAVEASTGADGQWTGSTVRDCRAWCAGVSNFIEQHKHTRELLTTEAFQGRPRRDTGCRNCSHCCQWLRDGLQDLGGLQDFCMGRQETIWMSQPFCCDCPHTELELFGGGNIHCDFGRDLWTSGQVDFFSEQHRENQTHHWTWPFSLVFLCYWVQQHWTDTAAFGLELAGRTVAENGEREQTPSLWLPHWLLTMQAESGCEENNCTELRAQAERPTCAETQTPE